MEGELIEAAETRNLEYIRPARHSHIEALHRSQEPIPFFAEDWRVRRFLKLQGGSEGLRYRPVAAPRNVSCTRG